MSSDRSDSCWHQQQLGPCCLVPLPDQREHAVEVLKAFSGDIEVCSRSEGRGEACARADRDAADLGTQFVCAPPPPNDHIHRA